MSEFYVGDEVQVYSSKFGNKIGIIVEYKKASKLFMVEFEDHQFCYFAEEIGLIKRRPYGKCHAIAKEICGHE